VSDGATRDGARRDERAVAVSPAAAPFVAQEDQQLHAQQAAASAVRGPGLDARVRRRRHPLAERAQLHGRRILPQMRKPRRGELRFSKTQQN
jgi:hypothetical protein